MKKIIAKILFLFGLSSSIFAYDWFAPRYFEVVFDVPFGISNNAVSVSDIAKKDLIIDFQKFADRLPEDGFYGNINANPSIAFNLNLRKFTVGVKTGIESEGFLNVSKDLFTFVAEGNKLGEKIDCKTDLNLDVFAYQEVSVGWKIKGFDVEVIPAFFVPLVHMRGYDSNIYFENGEDGSIIAKANTNLDLYTAYVENQLKAGVGFDLGGTVAYPLFDFLKLRGKFRIPIVPGHFESKKIVKNTMSLSANFQDIMDGKTGEKTRESETSDWIEETYYINRPLKLEAFADFTPFGNWVILTGGLGLGFRHPFTNHIDEFKGYGEYYLACTMALGNILGVTASTEYMDLLFKHQIAFKANVRVLEIDFGINAQSTSFVGSCIGAGAGGFITFKVGY